LNGKPLVCHSIEHALGSHQITRTIVSTDDNEIAAVAKESGAEVVRRPAEISGDTASSESALLHVLNSLRQMESYEPDLVVFLQATSPVRSSNDIDQAVQTLLDEKADSLLSASATHRFLWREGPGGVVAPVNYDYRNRPRRQDRPEEYVENGSIYVFKPRILLEGGNRLGGKIALYEMSFWSGFEIDDLNDFALCEWILAQQQETTNNTLLPQVVRLVVLDFDGVLTDNRVWVDESGKESIVANRGDGLGLAMLRHAGVELLVLSSETNAVVKARCEKLKLPHLTGVEEKAQCLRQFLESHSISQREVIYIGNDTNDLACFGLVGYKVAVADAHPLLRNQADLVLKKNGGHGAVREFCDLLLDHLQLRGSLNATGN
jgi:YrbI family 3-deoxy-D-manno-octulosonate 8-phosphate phosphatase